MNKWEYKGMRVWIIERNITGKEAKKRELNKEWKRVSEEMIVVKKKKRKKKLKKGKVRKKESKGIQGVLLRKCKLINGGKGTTLACS